MGTLTLNRDAVSDDLWDTLSFLMHDEQLLSFYLVGGTALSLQLGHRKSIDIDLFTHQDFNAQKIAEYLDEEGMENIATEGNTVRGVFRGIKLDILKHTYPLLDEVKCIDGVRMLSLKDIAAMKLNAIANRGAKKDFWDYAELLDHFSQEQMLGFFMQKYNHSNVWHIEKSLSYFVDADNELTDVVSLKEITWEDVKRKILHHNKI